MISVLIVEDELLEQEFLKSIALEELHPEDTLLTCESGTQAIQMAKRYRPDIIIMDLLIPEMDGLLAIQEIRNFLPNACITISSACSDFSYAKKAISFRVFDYLLKPVKPADFKQVFRKMLAAVVEGSVHADEKSDEKNAESKVGRQYFIEESLKYIHENFKEKLTLQMCSSYVFMNPQYFSRIFKKEVGVTYTDYVNNLKIVHACKLLETTNYLAYRISSECGFNDPSYFNRVFYQLMKMTPKEYKKNYLRGKLENNQ
jgi:YesN/AraC family two-component response regulator